MDESILTKKHLFLYNCLKQLDEGTPIDLTTLKKRIEFQKKIYLLQAFGVPLNFKFGSYLKGPYSSSLTKFGYTLDEMPEDSIPVDLDKKAPITDGERGNIRKLLELITDFPDEKNEYWLELISSLHFLLTQAYPPATGVDVKERLKRWKPLKFSDEDIDKSFELMVTHGLN